MSSKIQCPAWEASLHKLWDRGIIPARLHRVLVYGPPGTGKSSFAHHKVGPENVERSICHPQQYVEDFTGSYTLQNGSTVWVDGPGARAWKKGKIWVLDEIDKHSPETRSCLHSFMDDRGIASFVLPNGERITPAPGFGIVATMNSHPDELPEALRDRFDLILCADKPSVGILNKLATDGERKYLQNHYERAEMRTWTAPITCRSMLALTELTAGLGGNKLEAARHIFGDGAQDILNGIAVAAQ